MRIITAIGNPTINEELKKNEKFSVISKDILYKEGILEFLEENKNINIIIINEELDGKLELRDLIKKINKINNKIKIIVIYRNKNKFLKEEMEGQNVFKLYEADINFYKLNEIICKIENIKNNIKKDIDNKKDKKKRLKKYLNRLKNSKQKSKAKIKIDINIKIN